LVRSPAFALDLHSRDPAAFVREAEDGAVREAEDEAAFKTCRRRRASVAGIYAGPTIA
jgi:hypothetical protein